MDGDGAPAAFATSANRAYFDAVVADFGLDGQAGLLCDGGRESSGLGLAEIREPRRRRRPLAQHQRPPDDRGDRRRAAYAPLRRPRPRLHPGLARRPRPRLRASPSTTTTSTVGLNLGGPGCADSRLRDRLDHRPCRRSCSTQWPAPAAAGGAAALHHGRELAQPLRPARARRPHDGPQAPPVPPLDRAARTGRGARSSSSRWTSTLATTADREALRKPRLGDRRPARVAATPQALSRLRLGLERRVLGRPGRLRRIATAAGSATAPPPTWPAAGRPLVQDTGDRRGSAARARGCSPSRRWMRRSAGAERIAADPRRARRRRPRASPSGISTPISSSAACSPRSASG